MLKQKIAIVGLGYVGLPLAEAFTKQGHTVVGFDIDAEKIALYQMGKNSIGKQSEFLNLNHILFTTDETKLKEMDFIIVAVPTPVELSNVPNLKPLEQASEIIGRNLKKGATVVYESTVYPGVTEEICVPILESISGLKLGDDFNVGYSPERINPGDKVNTLDKITKIVSGNNEKSLNSIAELYSQIIHAGVYRVNSIKVAEAAKVIENAQRDVNIAFMNELSIMFHIMGIDTKEVLNAAGTKWNFINFSPGLVGGHCISVDPYYLTYRSEELGYVSQLILSARRINNMMGNYIAHEAVKEMLRENINVSDAEVLILGVTFKEDCSDLRNSKVFDIIHELTSYGLKVYAADPIADCKEVKSEYGIDLCEIDSVCKVQTIILAVAHEEYRELNIEKLYKLYKEDMPKVLIDVKGILNERKLEKSIRYWRL